MRKSKFSESQIVGMLKEAESGVPAPEFLPASRGAGPWSSAGPVSSRIPHCPVRDAPAERGMSTETLRESTRDPWSPPVNLGSVVNSSAYDIHPTLSFHRTTLIFASERDGKAEGVGALYMSTRSKSKGRD